MYNKSLDIFRVVAQMGSFSKASSQLFLTHTAVIKQINSLEEQLGIKLFYRTNQGITLTAAGQVLYTESSELINLSHQIIENMKKVDLSSSKYLLVGTSALYPCKVFFDLWDKIYLKYPNYQLKIVSFDNEAHRLDLLNNAYDFIISPFNSYFQEHHYHFVPLGKYRFCLSINRNHPLASRKKLSFKDLSGESIRIMKAGYSSINDAIREYIIKNYPNIHIIDIQPSYDFSTFNECADSQDFLLSLECWKDSHVSLKTISLTEEFYLPYGIVASHQSSETMQEFLKIVKKNLINNHKQ